MKKLIVTLGVLLFAGIGAMTINGIIVAGGPVAAFTAFAGTLAPSATMVGSYSSLKGIEYLIVLAFLVAFVCFDHYISSSEPERALVKA